MAGVARGGWESWEWDETLFAGAAAYYVQGRVPYAPGVGDTLVATLPLDGQGRLFDLGCGPGVVALHSLVSETGVRSVSPLEGFEAGC